MTRDSSRQQAADASALTALRCVAATSAPSAWRVLAAVHFDAQAWVHHWLFSAVRAFSLAKLQNSFGHLVRGQMIGLDGVVRLSVGFGTLIQE